MGPLALSMVGIVSLSPVISNFLGPIIIPFYKFLGAMQQCLLQFWPMIWGGIS